MRTIARKQLTFRAVWKALMEDRDQLQTMAAEADKRAAETDRTLKELAAEAKERTAETSRLFKELAAEADKRAKERAAEEEKRTAEADKRAAETARLFKELAAKEEKRAKEIETIAASVKDQGRQIGGLHHSIGGLVEDLLTAGLVEKFADFPYQFTGAQRNLKIFNDKSQYVGEVDCLVVNCGYDMAVECKRHLSRDDVDHHLRRMELLRKYSPMVRDKVLLGAVAGADVEPDVADYAHQQGLYVLSLSGDTVALTPRPLDFKAREW